MSVRAVQDKPGELRVPEIRRHYVWQAPNCIASDNLEYRSYGRYVDAPR